ncbi:MAG: OsmC family protein, partial [bacterium]
MLEAREIPSYPDKLHADVEGDIEDVGGTIVITKIRVSYHLKIPRGKREAAERALKFHPTKCPAAMSVKNCIDISWTADI